MFIDLSAQPEQAGPSTARVKNGFATSAGVGKSAKTFALRLSSRS